MKTKTKPKKTKVKTPKTFSNDALQPLIDHCHANRGGMVEVLRLFNEITGEAPARSEVQRWLAVDPDARTQPRFGTGLVLMIIFEMIQKRLATEHAIAS